MGLGQEDAEVVCRQLGYTPDSIPVCNNLSYITTPSHSIRTTSQAVSAGAANTYQNEA